MFDLTPTTLTAWTDGPQLYDATVHNNVKP